VLTGIIFDYPITDTIAISILIAPLIIRSLKRTDKVYLVIALLIVTPLGSLLNGWDDYFFGCIGILRKVLFGSVTNDSFIFYFPIVPWFAIFLAGTLVGGDLAKVTSGKISLSSLIEKMKVAGVYLFGASVFLCIFYKILKYRFVCVWPADLFKAIYPGQTTGLFPFYFAILLWVFAFLIRLIDCRGLYGRFLWWLSVLGRTSLFTYALQFAIVQSIPTLLKLRSKIDLYQTAFLFIVGVSLTSIIAYIYGRFRKWIKINDYEVLSKMVKNNYAYK
jgi:hypothetical protein